MQLTPILSKEIDDLMDQATHEKFTNGNSLNAMMDILAEVDAIETRFKELEETKDRYNRW